MAKPKSERLLYVGPLSSFSVFTPNTKKNTEAALANGEFHFESEDRPLIPGITYDDLPTDHPVIQNLIAAKLLTPPPTDAAPEAPTETVVTDSANNKSGDDRSTSAAAQEGKAK